MTVQRTGSEDDKVPFPGSTHQQKTVKNTQASIMSDCIGYDLSQKSQYAHLDSHI